MKRFRPLLLFAALLILAACTDPKDADGPEDPPAPPVDLAGVIVGVLTDAAGEPVVGQQVELNRSGNLEPAALESQAVRMSFTDEFGRFAFDVSSPGVYSLLSSDGSIGAFASVAVTQGPDGKLTAERLELQALELGGVSGSVVGQGAGVMAYLAGTSFLALTDADGDFLISRVPAGTYSAHATIGTITSAGTSVTVPAGGVVALATGIGLAPVISSVSPEGFYPDLRGEDGHLPIDLEYRLRGSMFGREQGLSGLQYAGIEVPVAAITAWSDTEIVVNASALDKWLNSTVKNSDPRLRDLPEDAYAFRVITDAGRAASSPTGIYKLYVYRHHQGYDPELARFPMSGSLVLNEDYHSGIPIEIEALDGRIVDAEGRLLGGPIISRLPSPELGPDFYVESPTGLPVIVSGTVRSPLFHPAPSEPELLFAPVVEFDPYVPGELVTGSIRAYDGFTLLPTTADFTMGLPNDDAPIVPVTVYPDGTFSAPLPVPAGFSGGTVWVYYRGQIASQVGL